jgi:hypothetical protein
MSDSAAPMPRSRFWPMPHSSDFAVGERVRVYPGSRDERFGVIVEDFVDSAAYTVTVGQNGVVMWTPAMVEVLQRSPLGEAAKPVDGAALPECVADVLLLCRRSHRVRAQTVVFLGDVHGVES